MLEIFDQIPQTRVFHVDRECYVVYLGSHWEDYKPFLRMGTSVHLPSELPPIVSSIVVPDALTGNPLDEPTCLRGDAAPDTRYVGDVETVEHMKSFVGQHTIPVEAIQAVDHEADDDRRVVVYYYKNGNLKIKFRKADILDLHRREQVDGHFIARAQNAKNEYGRCPFKLPAEVYQQSGFFVLRGVPYLISRGEIAALRLTDDYFFELSAAGIDADRVSTVCADDADPALIRFFKRSRTRNSSVLVATVRADRIRQASELFPANTLPPLKAKLSPAHDGSFAFHGFRVTTGTDRFDVALDDPGGSIVFGAAVKRSPGTALAVDPSAADIRLPGSKATHPLLEGAIYHLSGPVTAADARRFYLPEKNYPYRDMLSPAEVTVLQQLEYFFSELNGARDTGKVIRTLKSLDPIKAVGRADTSIHPVMQVLLHNYRQYAALVRACGPETHRGADALVSLLERHRIERSEIPAVLPLVGEIRLQSGDEYLFYRFAARITGDRYTHAAQLAERIMSLPGFDFEAERTRLRELIAALATPEQMTAARARRMEEARAQGAGRKPHANHSADGRAGEHREADSATGDKTPGASSSRPAAGGASGAPGGSRRGSGVSGRSNGRGSPAGNRQRGRPLIVMLATIIILVAALAALLLTGTIRRDWLDFVTSPAPGVVTNGSDTDAGTRAEAGTSDGGAHGTIPGTDDRHEPGGTDGSDATGSGEPETPSGSIADGADAADPDIDQTATDDGTRTGLDSADAGARLPAGWPSDSLPAIRALQDTPGVTITDTRVVGPGGIEITLQDIIDLVNRVATENGYARMGRANGGRPDPDWIYPGNVFALPDSTHYTVLRGDTLWGITVRYMVVRLRDDYELYIRLVSEYETDTTPESRRAEVVELLWAIGEASHTENFGRLVEETIDRWAH